MDILAIHHLGLAVKDLNKSTAFFIDCLGWTLAREVPEYPAKYVTNGKVFLTLWQTDEGAHEFNRRTQVGLHHFALKVGTEDDLNQAFEKVAQYQGVEIEFSPELLRQGPAKHFMIYEPGGIRIEFIWAP